ncbi:MAG: hypothetical protein N2C14_19375 [Planctomycetales bacterium]
MTISAPTPAGVPNDDEDGLHEVSAYPTPVELMGWPKTDRSASRVSQWTWTPIAAWWIRWRASVGKHMVIRRVKARLFGLRFEDSQAGREVLFRVLAFAPENEEPGSKIDAT